jgi:hypothetical protein
MSVKKGSFFVQPLTEPELQQWFDNVAVKNEKYSFVLTLLQHKQVS